jgi:hypothetical protein
MAVAAGKKGAAGGVTDPVLENFGKLFITGSPPNAQGRAPLTGFKAGGLSMTFKVSLPNLSDYGDDIIAQSKLTFVARHELKHTAALMLVSEIVYQAMEDTFIGEQQSSLMVAGIGPNTIATHRSIYFDPAKAVFDAFNDEQSIELHRYEAGRERGVLDPGAALILGTTGTGRPYPVADWKAWVLQKAAQVEKDVARALGNAVDFRAPARHQARLNQLYDWLTTQFNNALIGEGIPQKNLDKFND